MPQVMCVQLVIRSQMGIVWESHLKVFVWPHLLRVSAKTNCYSETLKLGHRHRFSQCAWVCPGLGLELYRDLVTSEIQAAIFPRRKDPHKMGWVGKVWNTRNMGLNWDRAARKVKQQCTLHFVNVWTDIFSIMTVMGQPHCWTFQRSNGVYRAKFW